MGSLILGIASGDSVKSPLTHKGTAIESALQQCLDNFRELLQEFYQVQEDLACSKAELLTQKEKYDSTTAALKMVVESKDSIIQLAASAVTRLNETKNLKIVNEILQILCGDITSLTPPKDCPSPNEDKFLLGCDKVAKVNANIDQQQNTPSKVKKKPENELNSSIEDVSFKEVSISEIDGTPGRTSPIIPSKKLRSSSSMLSGSSTDSREKKKCPDNWATSEPKQIKLTYSKNCSRTRQSKLCFTPCKPSSIVDLTCSPELAGGTGIQEEYNSPRKEKSHPHVQLLIKKESSDNDDTILPSPTSSSGTPNFLLSKTASKENQKFKKPLSLSRIKTEIEEECSPIIQVVEPKAKDFLKDHLDESVNLLKPKRFPKSPHKASPKKAPAKLQIKIEAASIKTEGLTQEPAIILTKPKAGLALDENLTHCEDTILQPVEKVETNCEVIKSPTKLPLVENMNITNVPPTQGVAESSMSLLQPEPKPSKAIDDSSAKRKLVENVEPIYKEPTVRKKAEKMALEGWDCEECKLFLGDLYDGDPEKMKAALNKCSKHRGRTNPARPKTPDNFWNPRWDVPSDTEEFNRRNNAV